MLWRLYRWRYSRHTVAVDLLQDGVDRSTIALWLGHEHVQTTQIYLDATLAMKDKALEKMPPVEVGPAVTARIIGYSHS